MKSLTALLIAIMLSSRPIHRTKQMATMRCWCKFWSNICWRDGLWQLWILLLHRLDNIQCVRWFWIPATQTSSDVKINTWNDNRSYMGHLGYRIPINRFYVTPIFGFILTQYGETDGHDWSVSTNGIKNKFHPHEQNTAFDAGLKCGYHAWNSSSVTLDFCLSATNHIVMAGIGLSF